MLINMLNPKFAPKDGSVQAPKLDPCILYFLYYGFVA